MHIASHGYRPGGVLAVCDRCDFVRRLSQLRTEWTGLKVCEECWDPEPADLRPPLVYPEGLPVKGARPEVLDLTLDTGVPDDEDTSLRYWMGLI